MSIELAPISEADLAELWFTLRNRTWRSVTDAVKASGVEQKVLAERIDMDPGQFSKVITGKKSNLTLRTLHNIARAVGYRLKVSLEPLADLPRPNYTYEGAKRIVRETPLPEIWNLDRRTGGGETRRLESVTAG